MRGVFGRRFRATALPVLLLLSATLAGAATRAAQTVPDETTLASPALREYVEFAWHHPRFIVVRLFSQLSIPGG
jgi:hypothetical protein